MARTARTLVALLAFAFVTDGCSGDPDARGGALPAPGVTGAGGGAGAGGKSGSGGEFTVHDPGAAGAHPCSAAGASGSGEGGLPEGGSDAGESGQAGSAEGGSRSGECPQPTHLGSRSEFSIALCGCVADSWGSDMVCFPLPSNRESCDDAYTRECVLSRYTCGLVTRGDEIVCTGAAPLGDAGVACCYLMHGECRYPVG